MSLSTRAVPDDAEDVAHAIVAQVGEEADVAAELQQVVLQRHLDVVAAVVPLEFFLGLLGEAHRPGHVRRPLSFEHQADDVAFLQGDRTQTSFTVVLHSDGTL